MKIKGLFFIFILALISIVLISCSKKPTTITIWVGSESTDFYAEKLEEYKELYKTTNGKDFPYSFDVIGVDVGSAAAAFLQDPEAGADILTVAHDNLGKLLEGSGVIGAITNDKLIEQMETTASEAFLNVCYLSAGDGSQAQYYGVPCISQALVLYYNKSVFAGKENKLATWEGILEVARENNSYATSFLGSDGYNFSCFLLAQPYSDDAKAEFGTQGTLEIYKKTIQSNCYNWGDDQIALMKYAQRFICDKNGRGGTLISNDGFATELEKMKSISVIGGAWSKGSVVSALGEDNYGVVELPTFTLTNEDAYGKATAGMVFHSGSFADCKCFVKKKDSYFKDYLDDILVYLSSDEIQEGSFLECDNLPASKNVNLGNNVLAAAQVAQSYYGIAQPFGFKAKFNTYYYSNGAPAYYEAIVSNTAGKYKTAEAIKTALQHACFIWAKGKEPADDSALATWVATQEAARK